MTETRRFSRLRRLNTLKIGVDEGGLGRYRPLPVVNTSILKERFEIFRRSDREFAKNTAKTLARSGYCAAISACLVGIPCRYDGGHHRQDRLPGWLESKILVPVCPEVFGGMSVPRTKSWFVRGDGHDVLDGRAHLVNEQGVDVTEEFLRGGQWALELARETKCKRAFLKERSPSCGVRIVWCGEEKIAGQGIFTAMLARAGITAESEQWSQETTTMSL